MDAARELTFLCASVRHVLGALMTGKGDAISMAPSLLDVAALLTSVPESRLARGQVGTIVELLDEETVLVEFSDDQGRAYAIAPCPRSELVVLRCVSRQLETTASAKHPARVWRFGMNSSSALLKTSPDRPLAGIGWMLAGIAIFSVNDALGKWLLLDYSVGELLLIRSAAALIVLLPFLRKTGATAFRAAPRPALQIVRIVLSALEVAMFFWAVSYLPLADAVTFYLAGPIYVTALSVVLLGEKVGWRRWSAVVAGFVGVVLALHPSAASFTLPAVIALTGSIFFAVLMITTRMLRHTPDMVLIGGQVGATLLLGIAFAPLGWVTPSLPDLSLPALFGVLSIVALACVNRSLKLAPASVVVPYQYTMIVWATVFGYAVFGDVPNLLTLAGAAIIIAAGLYIFWREQMRGQSRSTSPLHP